MTIAATIDLTSFQFALAFVAVWAAGFVVGVSFGREQEREILVELAAERERQRRREP